MNFDMTDGYIEFCPDCEDACIGPVCAAFHRGVNLGMKNACSFVNDTLGYSFDLEECGPLFVSIDVPVCSKYNKLIGQEAVDLYYDVLVDFGMLLSKENVKGVDNE